MSDDDDVYNVTTDDEAPKKGSPIKNGAGDSLSPKRGTPVKNGTGDDSSDSGFPELPDFFRQKHFLLYGEFNEKTKRSMIRYITAYDGWVKISSCMENLMKKQNGAWLVISEFTMGSKHFLLCGDFNEKTKWSMIYICLYI